MHAWKYMQHVHICSILPLKYYKALCHHATVAANAAIVAIIVAAFPSHQGQTNLPEFPPLH
jgi:hypothetical protein